MKAKIITLLILSLLVFTSSESSLSQTHLEIVKEEAPFPGYLYRPKGEGKYPGIVLLHGSEGGHGDFWYEPGQEPENKGEAGIVPWLARAYASRGYVTYAVCYFDCRHHQDYDQYPPNGLSQIDIKKITLSSIDWLRKYQFVQGKKVALWGASRGAEQAILLASLSSDDVRSPDAVISLSPSDYVAMEFSQEQADAIKRGEEPPRSLEPAWLYGRQTPKVFSPIQVEKIQKPALITYFTTDPIWGSYVDVRRTLDRLTALNVPFHSTLFERGQNHQSTLSQIQSSGQNRIFIGYNFSGHVYPEADRDRKRTEEFLLQVKAIEWFLDTHLNATNR